MAAQLSWKERMGVGNKVHLCFPGTWFPLPASWATLEGDPGATPTPHYWNSSGWGGCKKESTFWKAESCPEVSHKAWPHFLSTGLKCPPFFCFLKTKIRNVCLKLATAPCEWCCSCTSARLESHPTDKMGGRFRPKERPTTAQV